jgi:hypothetical protein
MRPRVEAPRLEEQEQIALAEGSEGHREKLARELSADLVFQAKLRATPPTFGLRRLFGHRRQD